MQFCLLVKRGKKEEPVPGPICGQHRGQIKAKFKKEKRRPVPGSFLGRIKAKFKKEERRPVPGPDKS